MTDSEQTPPTATAVAVVAASTPSTPRVRRHGGRTVLLLLLAFVLVGIAPMALAARVFGLWTPPALPFATNLLSAGARGSAATPQPTLTSRDLALPRAAWVAHETTVRAAANAGATLAQLEPGYHVTLLTHATSNAEVWDQISWNGPTPTTGGQGWVPDAALTAVGLDGPAVADAGALAPSLANALSRLGPTAALAVYYPRTQQLYLTNADHIYPLGDGARALVVAALLGAAAPTATPSNSAALNDIASQVAQDNPAAAAYAYQRIGGGAGLSAFLANNGISEMYPAPDNWLQTQATPRALVQFYSVLASSATADAAPGGLTADVRAQIMTQLAPDITTTAVAGLGAPQPAGATVALVLGAALGSDSWTVTATAVVALSGGLTYIAAVCLPGQTSQERGIAGAQAIFTLLATVARS